MPRLTRGALVLAVLAGLWLAPVSAGAQNLVDTVWNLRPMDQAALSDTHRGMEIVGMRLPPAADYDIPLADPAATVAKIKAAVERVVKFSPVSVRGLAALAKAGKIRIVYDAAFPERSLSRVVIAAYLVGEFQPQDGKRDFTVVVGRFGANWSVEDLAAVLVHELIGHGIQRLKNRFGHDRPIDLECEARLWQQLYYTDAKMPQDTREMVDFRRATDRRVCHDFRRFVGKTQPAMMRDWDHGRPDMPGLLEVFQDYYALIRKARARKGKKN